MKKLNDGVNDEKSDVKKSDVKKSVNDGVNGGKSDVNAVQGKNWNGKEPAKKCEIE
jgi:hypothetical protein